MQCIPDGTNSLIYLILLALPVLCPGLLTEGTLWFTNLTVPDALWILPISMGVFNLMNIEVSRPVLCPGLLTAGTLWFTNLTIPDALWILSICMGVFIEMSRAVLCVLAIVIFFLIWSQVVVIKPPV